MTFTKPVQDSRGLEITFPFPDLDHLYQTKVGVMTCTIPTVLTVCIAHSLPHAFHRPRRQRLDPLIPQEAGMGKLSPCRYVAWWSWIRFREDHRGSHA